MAEENIKENEIVEDVASESETEDMQQADTDVNTEESGSADTEAAAEQSEACEEPDESEEGAEPKKFFKKKDKKDSKDIKIEELTDQLLRNRAEFENFRKRTEKEKASMYEMGAKSVIEKILPVIDNFERGLTTVPEGESSAFYEGMQLVYKQLGTELENLGVKPIEAVGQVFDPNYHNAVMQMPSEEYESGVVVQELQKGYMYRDSVVRYSMVAVAE